MSFAEDEQDFMGKAFLSLEGEAPCILSLTQFLLSFRKSKNCPSADEMMEEDGMALELTEDRDFEEGDEEEISQEDTWTVISSYFEEKGLVRQQLDSFDAFIENTMQELVDESPQLVLQPEQHKSGQQGHASNKHYVVNFGQIYLSKPTFTESDGTTQPMFPNEARLRNLTYLVPHPPISLVLMLTDILHHIAIRLHCLLICPRQPLYLKEMTKSPTKRRMTWAEYLLAGYTLEQC